MNNESSQRIQWIDYSKGVAILLVLIGHCGYVVENLPLVSKTILSFHMPLFFFLSGLCFNNDCYKIGGRQYAIKQARRLIIPYIIFDLLLLLFSIVDGVIRKHEVGILNFLISMVLCRNIKINGTGLILWFLPCIFVVIVTFFFLNKRINVKGKESILILFVLFIGAYESQILKHRVPFCLDIALMGVFYYWIGNIVAEKWRTIANKIEKNVFYKAFSILLSVIFIVLLAFLNLIDKDTTYMYTNIYTKWYFLICESALGILIVLLLSISIQKFLLRKIMLFLGNNTLYVFGMNSIVYGSINFFFTPNSGIQAFIYIALCGIIISLVILLYKAIRTGRVGVR